MTRIPMRPDDKEACEGLSDEEMDALTFYVISGCTKEYAHEHFLMNKINMTKAAMTRRCTQFFAGKPAVAYLEAYRKTLYDFINRLCGGEDMDERASSESVDTDAINKRKAKAVQKIIEYILDEANHIKETEDPESLVKIADKVGLFDDFEKAVEAPRRYLPVFRCGDCRYYKFCTSEDVVDECKLCRYKDYAEENGVRYDHATMLRS